MKANLLLPWDICRRQARKYPMMTVPNVPLSAVWRVFRPMLLMRRLFIRLWGIFIVRNDAAGEGVSSRELVEEARRVARSYTVSSGRWGRALRNLPPALYTLLGSAGVGLMWLLTTLS